MTDQTDSAATDAEQLPDAEVLASVRQTYAVLYDEHEKLRQRLVAAEARAALAEGELQGYETVAQREKAAALGLQQGGAQIIAQLEHKLAAAVIAEVTRQNPDTAPTPEQQAAHARAWIASGPAQGEAFQPLAAAPAPDMVSVPREVVEFLRGAAPLEGVWFSERHPTERGAFWWRKHLPAAAPAPQQGDD